MLLKVETSFGNYEFERMESFSISREEELFLAVLNVIVSYVRISIAQIADNPLAQRSIYKMVFFGRTKPLRNIVPLSRKC